MKAAWASGRLGKQPSRAPQVIFGQVREDAEVELAAAACAPGSDRWLAIASGGCTALSLLLKSPARLDAIDINPAQIHAVELKRAVLAAGSPEEIRTVFERDALTTFEQWAPHLTRDAFGFWNANRDALRRGLLHCGIFDAKLTAALHLFRSAVHRRRTIETLLVQRDMESQHSFVAHRWNSWRWRFGTSIALHPALLRLVYGRAFTDRVPSDAAAQIRNAFGEVLGRFPCAENHLLWQTLAQSYPPDADSRPPYLRQIPNAEQLRALHLSQADATEWLAMQDPGSIQFFALSNILELAPPEQAESLSHQVARAAARDAIVVTRAIFPNHSPRLNHPALRYDEELTGTLRALDRTPICRGVCVFRVAG